MTWPGRSRRLLCALSVGLLASCLPRAGTDVGNGLTVKLNLQLTPAPVAETSAKVLVSGATVDELWMSTVKYRLTPGVDCSAPDPKIDVPGPAFADLLGPGYVGAAPFFHSMAGSFCKLQFEFHEADGKAMPAGAPPELAGASIFLRGHRADGVAFTVRSRTKDALRIEAHDGSFALDGSEEALVIGFDLDGAVAALELDTFDEDPIVFEGGTHGDQLKAFEKAIRKTSKLFADDDKDGKISDDESDADHELGGGKE